jgi:hypothetical protein
MIFLKKKRRATSYIKKKNPVSTDLNFNLPMRVAGA